LPTNDADDDDEWMRGKGHPRPFFLLPMANSKASSEYYSINMYELHINVKYIIC
jgi:hypothetical protein